MTTLYFKLILSICLYNSVIGVGFIGGKNCGTQVKIRTIKTLPDDPEDIKDLECVFVEDERALIKFRQASIEAKPGEISFLQYKYNSLRIW